MYRIILANRAIKELRRLDKISLAKAARHIESLKSNPLLGEKMAGPFEGSYRIKIPPLRIIYTPDAKSKTIYIRAIGYRGDVYKR
ncbi:MAG: type II toxin-antitoxin system RelE/ParE family toxin [Planctomycetes bacterium]|nr:type II toxin-antitoxin system RelE/ParE family toxin [Planctomycetota bacterium]